MNKNKKIKFGLLGLGNVVRGRVKNIFANELKNGSIEAVFDKDKKKVKEYSKYFKCSENFKESLFLKKTLKFVIFLLHLEVTLTIYLNALNIISTLLLKNHLY